MEYKKAKEQKYFNGLSKTKQRWGKISDFLWR